MAVFRNLKVMTIIKKALWVFSSFQTTSKMQGTNLGKKLVISLSRFFSPIKCFLNHYALAQVWAAPILPPPLCPPLHTILFYSLHTIFALSCIVQSSQICCREYNVRENQSYINSSGIKNSGIWKSWCAPWTKTSTELFQSPPQKKNFLRHKYPRTCLFYDEWRCKALNVIMNRTYAESYFFGSGTAPWKI